VARQATEEAFILGEGPVWDAERQRLLWVDITAGLVLVGRLDGSRIQIVERLEFPSMVGAVAPARDGRLLVATQEQLVIVDPDGPRTDGLRLLAPGSGRRLNDGKTDPTGRFVVGSLLIDAPGSEQLVRIEASGEVTVIDDGLTLSNGLAWSPDGTRFYSIDTYERRIWQREYFAGVRAPGPRSSFVEFTDGLPDGMCTDAEGYAWVAAYRGGQVRRFAPDGTLAGTVTVPTPHVTSVAFAGPGLDTLVITTARQKLTAEQLEEFPRSGCLFTVDVGVTGVPVAYWEPEYGTIA